MKRVPATITFSGMDNRRKAESLPDGLARNAVNVQFDNDGGALIPRQGTTLRYSGDVHSVFNGELTLFVEGGVLKRLNADNTVTALLSGVGDKPMYYTDLIDGWVYFNNGTTTGKTNGVHATEWGTARPPRQPDCTTTQTGGMYAGDYRVAITWVADAESGTGMGRRVTVAEGGGIHLTNFPTPPAYVRKVAVYVSSTNSKDMYLYGEYGYNVSDIQINRLTPAGVLPTIPLQTQFGFRPMPQDQILAHYGRIYYPRGSRLYRTSLRRYGLQYANQYWPFDSDIQVVFSDPMVNALYVGTTAAIYRVSNIDNDGVPDLKVVKDCAAVKGSVCWDPSGDVAYLMSHRGFIKVAPDGVTELTYDKVAIPYFQSGSMTVVEYDGLKYLVGSFQDGTQNPLANTDYNASELVRGSL